MIFGETARVRAGRPWLLPFWVALVIVMHISGLYLFGSGFLLTRYEMDDVSTCRDPPISDASGKDECWLEPRYRKAVILVVDALRFDFLEFNSTLGTDRVPSWKNKMTHVHSMLRDQPQNSLLYRFVADAPTVTMQRLKGLTTGGLPTFLDVSKNFGGTEIREDNLIAQFNRTGRHVVMMGDDTWVSLFPHHWHRQYPFPSFDVMDLDTVDLGVIQHLLPEMDRPDWHVIIGHCLGVDHVGHKYGPDHPVMITKMQRTNQLIRNITSALDNDTLFVLLGDHGMTTDGNHGGASRDETDAALFFYSKKPLVAADQVQCQTRSGSDTGSGLHCVFDTIPQVDLTPTLSLLLGTPIPFGNLGTIISKLFTAVTGQQGPSSRDQRLEALDLNAKQVMRYLRLYGTRTGHWDAATIADLERQLDQALKVDTVVAKEQYLRHLLSMCRASWTVFHEPLMISGVVSLVLLAATLVVQGVVNYGSYMFFPLRTIVAGTLVGAISGWGLGVFSPVPGFDRTHWTALTMNLGFCTACLWSAVVNGRERLKHKQPSRSKPLSISGLVRRGTTSATILVLLVSVSVAVSNSYILEEQYIITYLLATSVALLALQAWYKTGSVMVFARASAKATWPTFTALALLYKVMTLGLSDRVQDGQGISSRSVLDDLQEVSFLGPVAVVSVVVCTALQWTLLSGLQPRPGSVARYYLHYGLPVQTAAVSAYFALIHVGAADQLLYVSKRIAWVVYGVTIITIAGQVWAPIRIHWQGSSVSSSSSSSTRSQRSSRPSRASQGGVRSIHDAFAQLKEAQAQKLRRQVRFTDNAGQSQGGGEEEGSNEEEVVQIRDLFHVIIEGTALIVCPWLLSVMLLLGIKYALVIPIALVFLVMVVHAHTVLPRITPWLPVPVPSRSPGASSSSDQGDDGNDSDDVVAVQDLHPVIILILGLTAWLVFFATGHQCAFNTIDWRAAFIGFDGLATSYYLSGFVMLLRTWAGEIICAIALPCLLSLRSAHFDVRQGPSQPHTEQYVAKYMSVASLWLGWRTAQLAVTALSAGLQRRHLMVWAIFAPRFFYEAVRVIIVDVSVLYAMLWVARFSYTWNQFIRSIGYLQKSQ